MLNDSVATRRKFNQENLILCGFMVSTFDPEKTLVSQNTVIHCFSEKKKEQNFEPMLSVLKAKSSQEINVSFELKKSQSFHWSGHAPIFCSNLLDPRFYFVPVEVPSGFAVHVEENLPGALEGLFSFGVSTLVSLDDSQHLPQLNFTDSAL